MEKINFDIKTITIIVLGLALIITLIFGQKNNIDSNKDEINILHQKNTELLVKNDSILGVNKMLDMVITDINKKLEINDKKIADKELQIKKLNNEKTKIYSYVNRLSANGTASEFTKYLETKSSNNH